MRALSVALVRWDDDGERLGDGALGAITKGRTVSATFHLRTLFTSWSRQMRKLGRGRYTACNIHLFPYIRQEHFFYISQLIRITVLPPFLLLLPSPPLYASSVLIVSYLPLSLLPLLSFSSLIHLPLILLLLLQKKKNIQTHKRKLGSYGFSGFETFSIVLKTWATGTFYLNLFKSCLPMDITCIYAFVCCFFCPPLPWFSTDLVSRR